MSSKAVAYAIGGLVAAEATGVTNLSGDSNGGSNPGGARRGIPPEVLAMLGQDGGSDITMPDLPDVTVPDTGAGGATEALAAIQEQLSTLGEQVAQSQGPSELEKALMQALNQANQTVKETTDTGGGGQQDIMAEGSPYQLMAMGPSGSGGDEPVSTQVKDAVNTAMPDWMDESNIPDPTRGSGGGGGGGGGGYDLQTDYKGPAQHTVRGGAEVAHQSGKAVNGVVQFASKTGRTVREAGNLLLEGKANTTGTHDPRSGQVEMKIPGVHKPAVDGPIFPNLDSGKGSENMAHTPGQQIAEWLQ